MFCDADEFLHVDARFGSMDGQLAIFAPDVCFYTFPVAERVHAAGTPHPAIFDGIYRCRSARLRRLHADFIASSGFRY